MMAETAPAPNNKAVAFGVKPKHEPAGVKKLSAGGRKLAHAMAKRAIKRGAISEKAAKKHFGED